MPPVNGEEDFDREVPAIEQDLENDDSDGKGEGDGEGKGPNGWIPKARLDEVLAENRRKDAELQREREERIRAEERVKATKEPEKVYTRAELLAAVEAGTISQAQADEISLAQAEKKIRQEVSQDVAAQAAQRELIARTNAEMQRYKTLVPDVIRDGTDARARVQAEYSYLISTGSPAGASTELAALRAAFGSVERLEKRLSKRSEHETHQESGGRPRGDGGDKAGAKNGPPKGLPERYVGFYQRQIESGIYKGWDDPQVAKELARIPTAKYAERAKKFG